MEHVEHLLRLDAGVDDDGDQDGQQEERAGETGEAEGAHFGGCPAMAVDGRVREALL
jgi:hypothetical protein